MVASLCGRVRLSLLTSSTGWGRAGDACAGPRPFPTRPTRVRVCLYVDVSAEVHEACRIQRLERAGQYLYAPRE